MRRLVLLAPVLLPAAAHAVVLCPAARDGYPLRDVMLFDGSPSELASLVPEQQGRRVTWEVAYIGRAGRQAYLVCGYERGTRKLEVEVPGGSRACTFTLGTGDRIAGSVECR